MQESPEWHSQQGGFITRFNQLYRWGVLFRPDHYQFLFSSRVHRQSWASHLSHTSEGSQTFSLLSRTSSPQHNQGSNISRYGGDDDPSPLLFLRSKSPWCNGSSTHRFDKVSQWLQPQIDYLTGLPDIACGPRHPSPWFRLHLLAQFEIWWGGCKETPNCRQATKRTNGYKEARNVRIPGCHSDDNLSGRWGRWKRGRQTLMGHKETNSNQQSKD